MPILTLVWSVDENHRLGETTMIAGDPGDADHTWFCLGRCDSHPTDVPLVFGRSRPFATADTGPLESLGISRVQWRVRNVADGIEVVNLGRRQLLHNGRVVSSAMAVPGDLLEIQGEAMFLVGSRSRYAGVDTDWSERTIATWRFPFGACDPYGFVGESAAAWDVRRQVSFAAARADNVLIMGPSGSGKELAAQAVHALSVRGRRSMVSRNAATLPESIIDAELFGNVRDYPNIGTPERPGLVGAAEGSSLFLDEIGEISFALQAHLLRILDISEYQKLGDPRPRTANLRVIAATNRSPYELKHDLSPRLRLRMTTPGLNERRADIPLIALRILQVMAAGDEQIQRRFFRDGDVGSTPRWTAAFVGQLINREYTTHVRELETILLEAISLSRDGVLDRAGDHERVRFARGSESMARLTPTPAEGMWIDPRNITANQVRDALAAAGGSRERTWRLLGLRNRHQLMRLLRKYGDELSTTLTDEDELTPIETVDGD